MLEEYFKENGYEMPDLWFYTVDEILKEFPKLDKHILKCYLEDFEPSIDNREYLRNLLSEKFNIQPYNGNFKGHHLDFKIDNVLISINSAYDNENNRKFWEETHSEYRCIQIPDVYFWDLNRYRVILNLIEHALKRTPKTIYARKCKVTIKPAKELKEFFTKNNIQGYRNAKTAFCLEYENEVVMCYTVGHAWFGKGLYDAEIARGACKLGCTVVGGASKLWKAIQDYYNTHNLDNSEGQLNSIVYYCDLNYYNAQSLKILNTEFVKTQKGFWNYWVETKELKNREPSRHSYIMEQMKQGKILVLDNAGTAVYVWKRK